MLIVSCSTELESYFIILGNLRTHIRNMGKYAIVYSLINIRPSTPNFVLQSMQLALVKKFMKKNLYQGKKGKPNKVLHAPYIQIHISL